MGCFFHQHVDDRFTWLGQGLLAHLLPGMSFDEWLNVIRFQSVADQLPPETPVW